MSAALQGRYLSERLPSSVCNEVPRHGLVAVVFLLSALIVPPDASSARQCAYGRFPMHLCILVDVSGITMGVCMFVDQRRN